MKRTKIYLILLFLITNSCVINGNFKGLYSYYNKEIKIKPELYVFPENLNDYCNDVANINEKVLLLNGFQLKGCIQEKEKSLVYLWRPLCISDICIPIYAIERFCQENNIALYVVSEYYDNKTMMEESYSNYPIIGIDTRYYKTNFTSKYVPSFFSDLGVENSSDNFFLFKNSKLIKQVTGLDFQDLQYL